MTGLEIGLYVEGQEGATWHGWHQLATRADTLGFAALTTSVHLRSLEAPGRWALDLWPVLAAIALWTQRLSFGPLVLPVAFYPPAEVARLAAALDQLGDGRFRLSLGAGRDPGEHRAFGLPFPEHEERVAMLGEAVEAIRRLWIGQPVSLAGKWFHLEQAQIQPAPGRPWLGIGGNSEAILRLAAAAADDWCTTAAPTAELAQRLARLDALARAAGRRPQAISRTVMSGVLVGRSAAELRRRATRLAELVPRFAGQGAEATLEQLAAEWHWWVGSPEQVVQGVAAVARLGFDRVFFQVFDWEDLAAVELLAAEVVPRLSPCLVPTDGKEGRGTSDGG